MTELATFGGGCFWCLEAVFQNLKGVQKVESGYAGGSVPNPAYEQVCSGRTGHAEVVQITFDPAIISYQDLLEVFFAIHDPTTMNRQGADVGTQYRSVILYHSPEQQATAERVMKELESAQLWNGTIITQLAPSETFYRAESYHQNYFRSNPTQPYCLAVVAPKLAKFRQHRLASLLR
ncbi:MAG TPA: peptide-methionine (S)-S-oxide reductase MsrA [Nitrospiria bacterium]|nr:peptide-methionine (S)-S-oxide reductase MsrA [Nitrospiria bacterium]